MRKLSSKRIFVTGISFLIFTLACSVFSVTPTLESPPEFPTKQIDYYDLALDWEPVFKSNSETLWILAEYKNKLYVGGFSGQSDGRIYVFDGASWSDLNFSSPDGFYIDMIQAMYVFDGRLYIGGRVHDQNDNHFARIFSYDGLNLTIDFSTEGISGCSGIQDFKVNQDVLYAANGACGFGEVFRRDKNGNWSTLGGSFDYGIPVNALASFRGKLFAGTGGAGVYAKLWQWGNNEWELVKDFSETYGSPDNISSMASYGKKLYIGLTSSIIPAYNGNEWESSLVIPKCSYTRTTVAGGRGWVGSCNGEIFVNETGYWSRAGAVTEAKFINDIFQYGDYVYLATNRYTVYRAFLLPKK